MALNDVLCKVAETLGLKDTDVEAMRRKQAELSEAIRDGYDRIEELKKQVAGLDAKMAKKKKEYDNASSGCKRIVKEELKLLFLQQDRILESLTVITKNLHSAELQKHKISLLISAAENPSRIDEIEELTLDMKDMLDEQKAQSKAAKALDDVDVSSLGMDDDTEFDARMNAIGGVVEIEDAIGADSMDDIDKRIAELA